MRLTAQRLFTTKARRLSVIIISRKYCFHLISPCVDLYFYEIWLSPFRISKTLKECSSA